jgi:Methylamine utilisation protein MauE
LLLFLAGCSAACGALLVLAGASKVYRGARGRHGADGPDGDSAIRRVLRIPRRRWRRVEFGVGVLECAVGVIVCAGVWPVLGGVTLATLGAAFCVVLGYARARHIPGGCGCITWRPSGRRAVPRVSWAELARSAVLLGAGVAGAVLLPGGTGAAGISRAWFDGGLLCAAAVLALLSLSQPLRTPVCHRPLWWPLWRPSRATLRALTAHPVFAAMAESAGPFGPVARHHRSGCTEEFWFPGGSPDASRTVVFRVRYPAGDGTLAVQASLRTTITDDLSSYKP